MAFTAKGEVSLKLASLFFYILNKGGGLYWRMLIILIFSNRQRLTVEAVQYVGMMR